MEDVDVCLAEAILEMLPDFYELSHEPPAIKQSLRDCFSFYTLCTSQYVLLNNANS